MKHFLLGAIVAAALIGGALKLHLFVYDSGVGYAMKKDMSLEQTFIDARDLDVMKYAKLPAPVRTKLLHSGYEDFKKGAKEKYDAAKEKILGDK